MLAGGSQGVPEHKFSGMGCLKIFWVNGKKAKGPQTSPKGLRLPKWFLEVAFATKKLPSQFYYKVKNMQKNSPLLNMIGLPLMKNFLNIDKGPRWLRWWRYPKMYETHFKQFINTIFLDYVTEEPQISTGMRGIQK